MHVGQQSHTTFAHGSKTKCQHGPTIAAVIGCSIHPTEPLEKLFQLLVYLKTDRQLSQELAEVTSW